MSAVRLVIVVVGFVSKMFVSVALVRKSSIFNFIVFKASLIEDQLTIKMCLRCMGGS